MNHPLCAVPWCQEFASATKPETPIELQRVCPVCSQWIRNRVVRLGLSEARRQRDELRPAPSMGLGQCSACPSPATQMDLDGDAWCAEHRPYALPRLGAAA